MDFIVYFILLIYSTFKVLKTTYCSQIDKTDLVLMIASGFQNSSYI